MKVRQNPEESERSGESENSAIETSRKSDNNKTIQASQEHNKTHQKYYDTQKIRKNRKIRTSETIQEKTNTT